MFKLLKLTKEQNSTEEKWNAITHGIGAVFSVIGIILLLLKSDTIIEYVSSSIYGLAMLFTFSASAIYHLENNPEKKKKLRILDHSGIFFLIAGTYTPLALLVLYKGGYTLIIIEWSIVFFGVILKFFYTGRFQKLSLALYLIMGWIIIFEINNMMNLLALDAILLIVFGGIAYTVGAFFYVFKKLIYAHVIWHFFVLIGALFHFLFVYKYTL